MKKQNALKKSIIIILSVLTVGALICASCLLFMLDACEADDNAVEAFAQVGSVTYTVKDNTTVFYPEGANKAFIFYPGAKVEHEAYIPLMQSLSEKGVLCILVEMPLYFPLIDADAADSIIEDYPEIKEWYIGGHSLGGYAASLYLEDNAEKYEGFILLASYSGVDLTKSDLSVLSIYGTEDDVLNLERYREGLELLPEDHREVIIDGGCHTYFGTYTGQDEKLSKITNEEQLYRTVTEIVDFMSVE